MDIDFTKEERWMKKPEVAGALVDVVASSSEVYGMLKKDFEDGVLKEAPDFNYICRRLILDLKKIFMKKICLERNIKKFKLVLLKSCEPNHPIVVKVNELLCEVMSLPVQWYSNVDFYIEKFNNFKESLDTNYHLFTEFVEQI